MPRVARAHSLLALGAAVAAAALLGPSAPASAGSLGDIQVTGRGYGHGRGMGQWGALGYAVDQGWSYHQILDHYYGGTVAGAGPVTSVRVLLESREGKETVVTTSGGGRFLTSADGGAGRRTALRVARVGPATWQLYDGAGCGGPWTPWGAPTAAPEVTAWPEVADGAPGQSLAVCGDDGSSRTYRGFLSISDNGGWQHTVNGVGMQDYVRGVVPRESPASWGALGGGRGMEALKAQAVAARSYVSAGDDRFLGLGGATTCDTTLCQVYGGRGLTEGGTYQALEQPSTDGATAATDGEVRLRAGAVARTEFSSSTGGWTAGGTFPAVEDTGDAFGLNLNHTWSTRVPAADIESKYGIGQLIGIDVAQTNGLGAEGGRVQRLRVRGTAGTATPTGAEFRAAFGLKSDWFRVAALGPGDTKTPPAGGSHLPGWTLDAFGGLHPFEGAPVAVGAGYWPPQDLARALVVRPGADGYVLDAFGGLHPFGPAGQPAAPTTYGPGYWPGWDIARDAVLLPAAAGGAPSGYVLEGLGGLHPFGGAPDAQITGYWPGWDIARRVALNPAGTGGYVLDGWGGLHPFAVGANPLPPLPSDYAWYQGQDVMRDIVLTGPTAGYTIDLYGGVHPFGGASGLGSSYWPGQNLPGGADVDRTRGWVVYADRFGGLHTAPDAAPGVGATAVFPGVPVVRDVALVPQG